MKFRSDIPAVIGLNGLGGSGKSTVAGVLEAQGYERLRFAGPLKSMLGALLYAGGVPAGDLLRYTDGDLKEASCPILGGHSPRHAMQTLGTEWGRKSLHPELWVGLTSAAIAAHLAAGRRVVADDVRFPNEAAAIRAAGGEVWQVQGRGGLPPGTRAHASEVQHIEPDRVIDNSRCLDALEAEILGILLG